MEVKTVSETQKEELRRIFELQSGHQYHLGNQPISERKAKLKKLKKAIEENRLVLQKAVYADFKKAKTEVDATEILPVISEIKFAIRHINSWTRSESAATPLAMLGSSSKIIREPKGVSLIISPWNFPIMLTLAPLIGAIAAGCPVILKPSENTPHSSEALQKLINSTFDEKEVSLVQGAVQTSTDLLSLPFNHIYFTGAPSIGKVVMKAAAEHLASVTLELGGKSPVIVDESANLDNAAKRIAWAKYMNAGQICIAPDYALVHESIAEKFIDKVKIHVKKFYGDNPQTSDSYARIVNHNHYQRINGYLEDVIQGGGKFEFGGGVKAEDNYIEPTMISNLRDDATLLKEEIFGPILPIQTFKDISEVPKIVQSREKPLALYIYSKKKKNIDLVLRNTRAGGTAINHSLVHIFNPNLPFGGSNNSGIGKGMGKHGFMEFTNQRGVLRQIAPVSASDLLVPPYNGFKDWIIKITEKWLS